MSNIIDINQLKKEFEKKLSVEEWKTFAEKQNNLLEQISKENKSLKEKNSHLEQLLNKSSSNLLLPLSPEEKICIEQIVKLEELSSGRALTLEEVKRLDLLVKNLKLIREEATIVVNNKPPIHFKEADLVAIARGSESEEN